ncbi:MAG: type II secretion system protein [Nitrospira sp.]|nr:type II secretion system protein [Nitrospira sp.]
MKNAKCKLKNFEICNLQFAICNSRLPKAGGFTLLEIMIALAVIGGLLVTLIYTLNYHLGIAEKHEAITITSMLAKEKMAEIEKNPAETKGTFPEPYSDYHYMTYVKDTPYTGMSEISVTVSNGKEEVRFNELIQNVK